MDFTKKEVAKRFEAALRGARITGHKPMSEVSGKKTKRALAKPAKRK